MTKKTRKRLGIALVLILITGSLFMVQRKTPFYIFLTKKYTKPTQEEQIAYLKKNEQEMTDDIKSQNLKITSVQWDWESIKIEKVQPNAGGIPTGDKYNELRIEGGFNHIIGSSFVITWQLSKGSYYPKISSMYLSSPFTYLKVIDGTEGIVNYD